MELPNAGIVKSLRVAVLILVVGLSAVNFLVTQNTDDQIGHVAMPTPVPTATANTSANPFDSLGPSPEQRYNDTLIAYLEGADRHRSAHREALIRELLLITIAGAVWFAVGAAKRP